MNKPDDNFDVGLGFKVHNKRFDSLNEELDHVGQIMIASKYDLKVTNIYFDFIESISIRYAGYLIDEEKINKEVIAVENLLYDKSYVKDLMECQRMQREFTPKMHERNRMIIKRLNSVFRDLIKSFIEHELLPKPQKIQIKASMREEDPKKRIELQAEEFLDM